MALGLVVAVFACAGARAADLVSLEWGAFSTDIEGAIAPEVVTASTGRDELTLTMTLKSLSANADGAKTEDSASFAGYFPVQQPDYVALPQLYVELEGHIIKTPGATARLDVIIGNEKKTIEWKAGDNLAEAFTSTISATVADGQLPSPFPVAATLYVSKPADGGAVLVSLEKINLTVGQVRVAGAQK